LDDMGVSKLSAKVFLKVNYSFNLHRNKISNFQMLFFKLSIHHRILQKHVAWFSLNIKQHNSRNSHFHHIF